MSRCLLHTLKGSRTLCFVQLVCIEQRWLTWFFFFLVLAVAVADCGDGGESTNSAGSCQLEPRLDRYQEPGDYNTKFVHLDNNNTVQENEFLLSNASVTTVPFTVQRTTDVGGTLVVKVAFKKKDVVRFVSIWWYLFQFVSYKYV